MKKALLFKPCLVLAALSGSLYAPAQTVVVSDCNLSGWKIYTKPTGVVSFVNGPSTPPLGPGSVQFSLGTNGDGKAALVYNGLAGTPLSALSQLSYATYVQQYNSGQAPALELAVDYTGDGVEDDRLVFEPVYQTGNYPGVIQNGGMVLLNQWQTWNGSTGGWWAASDETAGPSTYTLSSYLLAHPTAVIANDPNGGGIWLTTGGGDTWTGFVGFADALTIGTTGGTTTSNFEACVQEGARLTVCHKGKPLTVSAHALQAHLNHGDQLGGCTNSGTRASSPLNEAVHTLEDFVLGNYPNPFTLTTSIRYSLLQSSTVSLRVFDAAGRQVAVLVNELQKAGTYNVLFNASAYGKGIYYYTLQTQSATSAYVQTRSMTVIR